MVPLVLHKRTPHHPFLSLSNNMTGGEQYTKNKFSTRFLNLELTLKAVDTIGNLTIIIGIKPYLVTSTGERLIV